MKSKFANKILILFTTNTSIIIKKYKNRNLDFNYKKRVSFALFPLPNASGEYSCFLLSLPIVVDARLNVDYRLAWGFEFAIDMLYYWGYLMIIG